MTNKSVFLDSSVLVEAYKGRNTEFLFGLGSNPNLELFYSETVISEFYFYVIAFETAVAPRTAKEKQAIPQAIIQSQPHLLLNKFTFLAGNESIATSAAYYMQFYNLLPNDALIFSICKHHNLNALASLNPDFDEICTKENLNLLKSTKDIEAWLKSYN